MSTTVKRSEFKIFIDTTPLSTPTWSLLGDGITSGAVNYNPETSSETYITQDSASIAVEKYAPTMPIEAVCKNGDAVFEFIDTLRRTRATLTSAETDMLMVYLYETPVSTDQYPAELQPISIQIDSFGGDGGASNKINFTINFRGNATTGLYDVSGNSFA